MESAERQLKVAARQVNVVRHQMESGEDQPKVAVPQLNLAGHRI